MSVVTYLKVDYLDVCHQEPSVIAEIVFRFDNHWKLNLSMSLNGDISQHRLFTVPYFSVGFSRLERFDWTAAIFVCESERNLGIVSKLPRGA